MLSVKSIKNLKSRKYNIFVIKHYFFSISNNCGIEDEKIFKEEESIEILKIIGLITNIQEHQRIYKSIRKYIIISEENLSQEFRLENIGKTRSYLIEEINQNQLMSKNH